MDFDYKQKREHFIRGHKGSTVGEIILLTTIGQLSNFLMITILSLFQSLTEPKLKPIRLLIEFIVIFIPFVLSVTLLSEFIFHIFITIILLTITLIIICFMRRETKPINMREILDLSLFYENRLPFASNLMSSLLLCVCVSILAVDFEVFSRRFAKTEIYGWSLMDVGVGAFIAINGGLSPESRLGTASGHKPSFLFKKTVLSTIPLLVLGFQRLATVKSLNYHEHITEYGLHWNFFFTLAFTKLFSTTFCCLFSSKVNIGLTAIILLIFHQICLTFFGLSTFIQNDDRNGLFAANKEGIISLLGYLSLHLFFVEVGRFLLRMRKNLKEWLQMAFHICLLGIIFAIIMFLSNYYIEEVSRREANLSFVCWMITFISVLIALELFIQAIVQTLQHLNVFPKGHSFQSIIYSSIGYSGMLLFLISNLLTGLVNFTIDTISTSDLMAVAIILIYCSAISFVAVLCTSMKIQLKLPMKQKSD